MTPLNWPVTIEEAGEIILAGEPYEKCPDCNGVGFITHAVKRDETRPQPVNLPRGCLSCNRSGQVIRREYITACHVLGKDLPPFPVNTEASVQRMEPGKLLGLKSKL